MMRYMLRIIGTAIVAGIMFCSPPSSVDHGGGGSEVEVVGYVFYDDEPAPSTQVKLIPVEYNAGIMGAIGDSMIDTTDAQGRYAFNRVAPGRYNVQALQLALATRMLLTGIEVTGDTTLVPTDSLHYPGTIRLQLPDTTTGKGYATITGTDIIAFVTSGTSEVILDSVPAGSIPEIIYSSEDDGITLTRENIPVLPSRTIALVNPSWNYFQPITLNTTKSGADVEGDVYRFPVLIRLSADNFDFTEAGTRGDDLRFTSVDGKPFPFEIQQWDTEIPRAAIWVNVDTIFGNNRTQMIIMYWGNTTAVDVSDGSGVFDTTAGFQGVWHMEEFGNDSARDATSNGFTGAAYYMPGTEPEIGVVGNARPFDGDSSFLTMPHTASGKLNFSEDGYFTVSAWVYVDTFDNVYRTIVAKGFEQYFLQLTYFPSNEPQWEFSTFSQEDNWHMSNYPATEKQWMLLTGVKQGSSQYLYCNGELTAATSAIYPQGVDRDTTNDLSIGRFLKEATYPAKFGYCYFKGSLDEVRISDVSRNQDWIRLCYMNQRRDDRLVEFK